MTHPELVKLETIIQKLDEGIRSGVDETERNLFDSASEYAAHCKRANDRLATCAEILSGGPDCEYQALMAATHQPDVLELCAVLSELQTDEYHDYCKANHLPLAEPLNERAKQQIDPLYGKAGTFQGKLMGEFSAANSVRDFKEALRVIRQVATLNPSDASARKQAKNLEDRLVRDVVVKLKPPLRNGEDKEVLEILDEIEALAPGREPSEDRRDEKYWREALTLKCTIRRKEAEDLSRELLPRAEEAMEADCLTEAMGIIGRIASLMDEHDFVLRPEQRAVFEKIDAWTAEEVSKKKEDDDYQHQLDELREAVRTIRNKEFQNVKPNLDELREDNLLIQRMGKDLYAYAKPIPDELDADARSLLRELGEKIQVKETAKSRNLIAILTTLSAVLIVAAVTAVMVWKASQEAGLIEKAVAENRATDIEKRIGSLESDPPVWIGLAGLGGSIAKGKTWLENNKGEAARVDQMVSSLERKFDGDISPEEWTTVSLATAKRELALLEEEAGKINADYRIEIATRIGNLMAKWEGIADAKRNLIVSEFHEKVGTLENSIREKLGFEEGAEQLDSATTEIAALILEMDVLAESEVEELAPSAADLAKYEILKEKFGTVETKVQSAREVMAECRVAADLDSYAAAAKGLLQTDMLEGLQKLALSNLLLKIGSEERLLREIMLPDDLPLWTQLTNDAFSSDGFPETVEGAEKANFLGLRDDDLLAKVWRYPMTESGKTRILYSTEIMEIQEASIVGGMKRIDAKGTKVYDPKRSGDEVVFKPASYKQRKVPGGLVGAAPESGGLSPESAFFKKLKIDRYVDPAISNYQRSLLSAVDQLGEAGDDVSPLFLAYIHLTLADILTDRPDMWLLEFCDFKGEVFRLREIVGPSLDSSSWCSPSAVAEYAPELKEYYRARGETNHAKTAKAAHGFHARLITAGLELCGHYGLDGNPFLSDEVGDANTLWGLDANLEAAILLKKDSEGKWKAGTEPAAFTPLFKFGSDPEEVLAASAEAARLDNVGPELRKQLPPRFQNPPE